MKQRSKFIVVVLVAIFALAGCTGNKKENTEQVVPVAVQTVVIEPSSIEKYTDVSTKIVSKNQVTVIPKASGTVNKVYVKIGQRVNKGDAIAIIDDTELQIQLSQAKAAVELAKANAQLSTEGTLENSLTQMRSQIDSLEIQLEDAQKNLVRMEELYQAGAISKADLEKTQVGVDTLVSQLESAKSSLSLNEKEVSKATQKVGESAVKQAEVALENVQNMISNTRVIAEVSGTITNLMISEGNTVAAGTPIAAISDDSGLKLSFQVSQDVISTIDVGTPVEVKVDGNKESIKSEVANLSKSADIKTALYPVEVNIEDPSGNLHSGMFATVRLISQSKDQVTTLPINAVVQEDGKNYVYKVDQKKVEKVEVEIGIQNQEMVEITSGVNLKDEIVIKGQDYLEEGSAVNVVGEGE